LATLTGQAFDDVSELNKNMPIAGPTPALLQDWINTALANNSQLAAQKHQMQAAKEQIKAEKSGHLPTIDATASYSHAEEGGTSFLGNESDTEIFALEFTLPLFEGGGRSSKVREARYRYEQTQQTYEGAYRTLKENVQTQHRTVTTDVLRIRARKAALKSSEAALEATLGGYDVGTRNIVDVLQAQNTTFNAQRDYANAIYDYIINLLTLKQLAGTLNQADLAEFNQWLRQENQPEATPS
jgi:outer membrane protein